MKKGSFGKRLNWFVVLAVTFVLAGPTITLAQQPLGSLPLLQLDDPLLWDAACTSIMVGKLASTDGSVMTAHTCDGNYRTWLRIEPRQTYPAGTMRPIVWGTLHTETPWDTRRTRIKGEIPESESTYAFMNVAYPCLNEKQLAIGETTIGGRRELRNEDGLFLIEELQKIVLQRCTTAREAVQLIGELVKAYGYGDGGECLTFADPAEGWHFEIMGAGPFEVGAVWAAARIPDDHVGVSANIPRISTLDLDDPDNYMASENVHSLAEEMGWWDPDSGEEFKWWKAYSGRRPYSTREYFILSTMAPELGLTMDMEELPFTVKPNRKIDVREVLAYYRQTYEGTELDVTQNLLVANRRRGRGQEQTTEEQPEMVKSSVANPWMSGDLVNLLNSIKPGSVQSQRQIAIARCSYSQIIQCRDWLPDGIGGVAWFSFDNPGQSPRIPIFAGVLELPENFEMCGQHRYTTDSACWSFRRTNRLSMIKWGATRTMMEEAIMEFEERGFNELPGIEQKALELFRAETDNGDPMAYREFLTKYTNDFARAAMNRWWELGDQIWMLYARGF
jgi:dipeptidase